MRYNLLAELEGAGLSGAVAGTSVGTVADSEGLVEDTTVEDGRSDSLRDVALSEGVGVGVAEGRREALSCAVEAGDSSEGLSSCRRTAA